MVRRGPDGLAVGAGEPGRGAWLCRGSVSCVEQAVRHRKLAPALRGEVSIQAQEWLRTELATAGRG